jgi:tellurite resistance protein TehA-like permease
MPIHLDHVLYTRARWRKTLLVPLWTFQVAVLLCLMAVFAYRLAETFEHYKDSQKMGQIPMVEVVFVLPTKVPYPLSCPSLIQTIVGKLPTSASTSYRSFSTFLKLPARQQKG